MNLHAITGMPRSGSTLLCNILAQNETLHVTDTDVFPNVARAMVDSWSSSIEIQHQLGHDPEALEQQLVGALQGAASGWYIAAGDKTVFSKSRSWSAANYDILRELDPDAKLIVTVRSPLSVFASCEKHHRKMAGKLDDEGGKTLRQRADDLFMFSDKKMGLIGRSLAAILDLFYRKESGVLCVKSEAMSSAPAATIRDIYKFVGLPEYSHDFDNVVNVSNEPDHVYLNRFPHEGHGKVEATDVDDWKEFFSEEFAQLILANDLVKRFCHATGYHQPKANTPAVSKLRRRPRFLSKRT